MLDFYTVLVATTGFIIYDAVKYAIAKLKRRWGENPPDATYFKERP